MRATLDLPATNAGAKPQTIRWDSVEANGTYDAEHIAIVRAQPLVSVTVFPSGSWSRIGHAPKPSLLTECEHRHLGNWRRGESDSLRILIQRKLLIIQSTTSTKIHTLKKDGPKMDTVGSKEDGYSILELLLVVAILLVISGIGAWTFIGALQSVKSLLALIR